MSERERMDPEARDLSGVTRHQNVIVVLPQDTASMPAFLAPALERVDRAVPETQLLVLTPDPDTAIAAARELTTLDHAQALLAMPVTTPRRAIRRLRAGPVHAVAGNPDALLELIRHSAVKLAGVRALVIAWADTLLDQGSGDALAAILAEIPREAARTVVTSRVSPEVEELAERYARRARRVGDVAAMQLRPVPIQYVTTSAAGRTTALRRLLDDLDPDSAAVYARTDASAQAVGELIRDLGFAHASGTLSVTRGEPVPDAKLLVLYELPTARAELQQLVAGRGVNVVALVRPAQLEALRSLAAGGAVTPLVLSGSGAAARAREERFRAELRQALSGGAPARELLTLEPLLDDFDGIELAAALLRLLEDERRVRTAAPEQPGAQPRGTAWTRLFINAGARDGVSARDIVGAVLGETGLARDRLGRVDVRESHSTLEVAAPDAERIVRTMTGVSVRGRRLVVRVDSDDRPARPSRPRAESARRGPPTERGAPPRKR
ncbi:MAG TPA: DEAD/DEAH box helicase [Gemmatimonadaceae bacterium]|nr:DEAD/DEAH box helicase [Gemmatimonadaceae bacterium]